MNVLLEFSRLGLEKHGEAIRLIRTDILKLGHTLTHDLLKNPQAQLKALPEDIYKTLLKAISTAECVIIEGSTVSLSLGFVLTEAINLGKPVLFLVQEDKVTQRNRFVGSIKSKLLVYKTYQELDECRKIVNDFFINHSDIKTRFNLVLSNKLNSYITVQSHKAKTSKTEYLISLIEADMNRNLPRRRPL